MNLEEMKRKKNLQEARDVVEASVASKIAKVIENSPEGVSAILMPYAVLRLTRSLDDIVKALETDLNQQGPWKLSRDVKLSNPQGGV